MSKITIVQCPQCGTDVEWENKALIALSVVKNAK